MVGGLAEVNSDLFAESKTQCVVISYDYTVMAGTQGGQNHRKKDRLSRSQRNGNFRDFLH